MDMLDISHDQIDSTATEGAWTLTAIFAATTILFASMVSPEPTHEYGQPIFEQSSVSSTHVKANAPTYILSRQGLFTPTGEKAAINSVLKTVSVTNELHIAQDPRMSGIEYKKITKPLIQQLKKGVTIRIGYVPEEWFPEINKWNASK
ncbi:MAG: hypothetical protein HQL69_12240 [Magnetococcales bacterium]|nr:hypothetical protein [Magnetococcales bacterium]